MTDLSTRYGSTSPRNRVIALVLIVALAVSTVGYLGWVVLFHSNPQVQSRLTAYDVSSDHLATATLNVVRESASTRATCRLQAVAEDHTVVGELDLPVTSGPTTQAIQVEIRTERRATSVSSLGCITADQPRPR